MPVTDCCRGPTQPTVLKVGLRSRSMVAGSWSVTFLPNSSTTSGCSRQRGAGKIACGLGAGKIACGLGRAWSD